MTGEKKTTDISARLGVKRTKPSLARLTKSSVTSPPKAAITTAKPKKEETQRRDALNAMLHPRKSREKDRGKAPVSNATTSKRGGVFIDDAEYEQRMSQEGGDAEPSIGPTIADKVAGLERALSLAREEQNAMMEELAKLREQGAGYRESLDECRRQLAERHHHAQNPSNAIHPNSRPTSSNSAMAIEFEHRGRSNSYRRDDLLEQNHHLQARVAHLQDQLASQEAHFQSRMDQIRSRNEPDWHDLTSRLHATEKESQERLQQLLSLKSTISSLTRMDTQITDSELAETLSQLANRVREWVIGNYRRTKLDLSSVSPETAKALEAVSPEYRQLDPSNRLALFQSLISSTMMQIFHEPIAVGLPETGPLGSVRQLAAYIRQAGTGYCEWRRTMVRSLEKGAAQHALQQEVQRLTHRLCGEIAHHLFVLTSISLTAPARAALEGILHTAADFQNTLLLQKAHYRVFFFCNQAGQKLEFDERRMEQINDLDSSVDEDRAVERRFSFCVFPGLEKFGDEYGDHADFQNMLFKASVCCDA